MSKKSWKLAGVVGTVLVVGTLLLGAVAFAQAPQNNGLNVDSSSYQSNFIDEDGDGVCDLMGEDGIGMQYGSMNGGQHGNMSGDQSNFIDEDGDGVCDLMGEDGTGIQYGRNGSRGHGNK